MYENWFRLSRRRRKAENPWGQDPYGGPEIQKRLLEGQSDRLTADLPDLDKGFKHFPEELAETLYGFRLGVGRTGVSPSMRQSGYGADRSGFFIGGQRIAFLSGDWEKSCVSMAFLA